MSRKRLISKKKSPSYKKRKNNLKKKLKRKSHSHTTRKSKNKSLKKSRSSIYKKLRNKKNDCQIKRSSKRSKLITEIDGGKKRKREGEDALTVKRKREDDDALTVIKEIESSSQRAFQSIPNETFYKLSMFLEPTDIRNLSHANKSNRITSKSLRTLNLNIERSNKYALNKDGFRDEIKGRVASIKIDGSLNEEIREIIDISFLRDIPIVSLSNMPRVSDLKPLENARSVTLDSMDGIESVSPLKNVHTVHLKHKYFFRDLNTLKNVKNIVLTTRDSLSDIHYWLKCAKNNKDPFVFDDPYELRRQYATDNTVRSYYFFTGFESRPTPTPTPTLTRKVGGFFLRDL
jgi:hypothetical protein